jgi:hypothetical protein
MTLKQGRQKAYFENLLRKTRPELDAKYLQIYSGDPWGNATAEYYNAINSIFSQLAKNSKMPRRMPPMLFKDILSENDLVIVMLEHIEYFLRLEGKRSSFGYVKDRLREIKGVGEQTEKIILEILQTKNSSYYESLS